MDARADEIVYAFQVPLPRDDRVLRMHRFFQTMTAILQLQVLFPPSLKSAAGSPNRDYDDEEAAADESNGGGYNETAVSHPITMRAKLAHHSHAQSDDQWDVMASARVSKDFKCVNVCFLFEKLNFIFLIHNIFFNLKIVNF